MRDTDSPAFLVVIVALTVAIIAMLFVIWMAGRASAGDLDPACLTRDQARAKYPGQWLYWHGVNHCWDNQRIYARPVRAHKGPKYVRPDEYNELDAQADREPFFRGEPMPVWQTPISTTPRFIPWEERIE